MGKKQLNYSIRGEGYPLVFIHGFLANNSMWDTILNGLPSFKKICIELPGHGESPYTSEDNTLTRFANKIHSTLKSLKIDKFTIIGHSLGGYVALHLAEILGKNIEKIILFHSHPWADSSEKQNHRSRAQKIIRHNQLLFIREAIPNLFYSKNQENFASTISQLIKEANTMHTDAIVSSLEAIKKRGDKLDVLKYRGEDVTIIQGEFDSLIDANKMQETAQIMNAHFYRIKNIGHMGHIEAPKQVIAILKKEISNKYTKTTQHSTRLFNESKTT